MYTILRYILLHVFVDGLAGNYRMIINPNKDPNVGTVFTGEKLTHDMSRFISGEVNKGA